MEYRVLGPLELLEHGRVVEVRASKLRIVLATLLLGAGRTVTIDELIDLLWDGSAPKNARAVVQKYVMRVRRIVVGDTIRTEPDGYRMLISEDQLDLTRFRALVAQADMAAKAEDFGAESEVLNRALELWSGRSPLINVSSDGLARSEVPRLIELHTGTLERRIDLDLRLGRHRELVGELVTLVREHPLREHFWVQWMRALHKSGRTGEALSAYREISGVLADELGVGPGEELREAYMLILRDDAESAEPAAERLSTPHLLPIAGAGFVGRTAERGEIAESLRSAADVAVAPVVLITGAAGIGKTTLAVHVAHGVADAFPDGQLYCDFRAYAPGPSLSVGEVLGQFLHALGQPAETIPIARQEQTATYRSLLAGKRVLIVLDNVASEKQVRELLPGASGSAVLVTSRNELTGLVVDPGAKRVGLDVLSPQESHELLVHALGAERVSAARGAMRSLTATCGGLALALRLAAAHLTLRPGLSISDYVGQLRRHGAVSELRVEGDERADLSGAFGCSYDQLRPKRQYLLRMLSLVADTAFSVHAACAAMDLNETEMSAQLEELAAASLLMRSGKRYKFHDLIRQYAWEQCLLKESDAQRIQARERLLEYYIAKTDLAVQPVLPLSRLPRTSPHAPPALEDSPTLESVDDDRLAMIAAIRAAATYGPYELACQLADALRGYFGLRGHSVDWHAAVEGGIRAAEHAGYREGLAAMYNSRGALCYYTGDVVRAERELTRAVELYEGLNSTGANAVRINLGIIAQICGNLPESVAHLEASMLGYRDAGEPALETRARENLVLALVESGDLARASAESAELKAAAARSVGHLELGAAAELDRYIGDLHRAAERLSAAADEAAAHGDRRNTAGLLDELANCLIEMGEIDRAHRIVTENIAEAERYDPRSLPYVQTTLAKVFKERGNVARARRQFTYALGIATQMHDLAVQCDVLTGWADLELVDGDTQRAFERVSQAVELAQSSGRRLRLVHATAVLAACHRAVGSARRAREIATEALQIAVECEYPLGEATARHQVAESAIADGDADDALDAWTRAASIYSDLGSARAAVVRQRLAELQSHARN
ncbi:AfsR/SARP family transcriptional regulator [Solicola gregarius]|uniref:NB-ARC domain-containing protein n=1 Tax=Solicola gregarius TaxID=2908642 RepID=A0AA46YM87_9ACTN|nr:BTAD domain-containing putative transcriptional regulator [Solicola gregarius]UYM06281.1 NB-ARC domain-containing protein [Solicola gregarius]